VQRADRRSEGCRAATSSDEPLSFFSALGKIEVSILLSVVEGAVILRLFLFLVAKDFLISPPSPDLLRGRQRMRNSQSVSASL
jgi:hypothetical protein